MTTPASRRTARRATGFALEADAGAGRRAYEGNEVWIVTDDEIKKLADAIGYEIKLQVGTDAITECVGELTAEVKAMNEHLAGIKQILADIAEAQESMAGLRGDDDSEPDE